MCCSKGRDWEENSLRQLRCSGCEHIHPLSGPVSYLCAGPFTLPGLAISVTKMHDQQGSDGVKPVAAQQVDKQVQPCQSHWVLLFLLKGYLTRWLLMVLPVAVHLWTRPQPEKAVKAWSRGDHSWVNLEVGRNSCNFRG